MATRVTAVDIIRDLPQEALNSPVSDLHIAELASEMKNWEHYVPYLGLTEAEEEEIRRDNPNRYGMQKREFLRKWKAKQRSAATYHQLIIVFCLHNTELAEKAKQLLLSKLKKQPTKSSVLDTFQKYLVDCYVETPHPSHTQWPFSGISAYIDLMLLEVPENPLRFEISDQKSLPSPQPLQLSELFSAGRWKVKRKVILIEGPAGCGKTTLMWHACREWAAGRLFTDVNLLIHISLKDPTFHSAKCLADIIPHPSSEMREAVARAIANQRGKGVCFLFDSWDEVPHDCLQDSYLIRFIAGSSGKMLPRCSIVVTSRSVGALPLYSLLTARLIVRRFGYTEIEKFIDTNLGESKEELLEAFQKNSRLVGLCNLPINAAIVIHLFHSFNHKLPSTRTELFTALVSNILVRHMQLRTSHGLQGVLSFDSLPADIQSKLREVCFLAFHGVMKGRSVFGHEELKVMGVATHKTLETLGLLQVQQQLTGFGPLHRYGFLHYAVQEFLAAYHVSQLSTEKQSKVVGQILHNNPLSLVLPFFAGLTKLSNSNVCSILMEVTKNPLDFASLTNRMVQNPDSESSDSRRLLLALMNCIYESQNKDICKLVNFHHPPFDPRFDWISFQALGLDPTDCMSIGYFFANKQLHTICIVELCYCRVGDIGIEVFMKELSQGRMHKDAMGIELVLAGNDCSHCGLKCISEAMSQAQMLWGLLFTGWIVYGLDAAAPLAYLVEGLCRRSTGFKHIILDECVTYKHTYHLILLIVFGNLQCLDLSCNDISNSLVMSLLVQSLKHSRTLEEFGMSGCNINDDGLQHLGTALQDNKTLTQLNISNNPFSSKALTYFLAKLFTTQSRLQILRLGSQWCKPLAPEHSDLLQKINTLRLQSGIPPFIISEPRVIYAESHKIVKSFLSLPPALSWDKNVLTTFHY